ncbi:MAG TPA: IS1182 family transposase, partial [Leucothrix mucor]|nr:IS1182 family transposase [Leucothrix mucor]
EDQHYKDKTGDEIPEELTFKQQRLEKIQAAKKALEAREKALYPEQTIDDKKQISFADHDARIMGKKGSEFTDNYNPQISVDSDYQIIVGQPVSQKANDKQEVKRALEQLEITTGRQPDKMSLDNGYHSGDNLQALEKVEIEAYVALNKADKTDKESLETSTRKIKKSDFLYDKEQDQFICPADQILPLIQMKKNGRTMYQGKDDICAVCHYQSRCCQSKKELPEVSQGIKMKPFVNA